jgi:hypothetical protein
MGFIWAIGQQVEREQAAAQRRQRSQGMALMRLRSRRLPERRVLDRHPGRSWAQQQPVSFCRVDGQPGRLKRPRGRGHLVRSCSIHETQRNVSGATSSRSASMFSPHRVHRPYRPWRSNSRACSTRCSCCWARRRTARAICCACNASCLVRRPIARSGETGAERSSVPDNRRRRSSASASSLVR